MSSNGETPSKTRSQIRSASIRRRTGTTGMRRRRPSTRLSRRTHKAGNHTYRRQTVAASVGTVTAQRCSQQGHFDRRKLSRGTRPGQTDPDDNVKLGACSCDLASTTTARIASLSRCQPLPRASFCESRSCPAERPAPNTSRRRNAQTHFKHLDVCVNCSLFCCSQYRPRHAPKEPKTSTTLPFAKDCEATEQEHLHIPHSRHNPC